jgi:sterol desaturase/sphingolipid hydroxylase (fatty acid hydroxylase superfamily)
MENVDHRRRRRHRAGQLAIVAVIGAISFVVEPSAAFGIAVIFALIEPFEKLFPRHRGQRVRRGGLGTDLVFAVASPVLSFIGLAIAIVAGVMSFAWLPGLVLRPIVSVLPTPLLVITGALLFDLAGYWVHRFAHENATLWRFHWIHHSSEHLDWLSGVRVHPLDGVLIGPPVLLLIAAGFPADVTGGIAVAQIVIGLFLHANVRWRLRPLHRIVATPDFHHWHHANEPEAVHTNYAAFLPLWDQLFGTFRIPRDRQPLRYGIDDPLPTNFVGLLIHPFAGLRRSHRK